MEYGRNYEAIILDTLNTKTEGKTHTIFSSKFLERMGILMFLLQVT